DANQHDSENSADSPVPNTALPHISHSGRNHWGPSALILDNDVRTYLNAFPTRRFFENGNIRASEGGAVVTAFEAPLRRPRARTRSGRRTIRPRPSCIRSPGSEPCSGDG